MGIDLKKTRKYKNINDCLHDSIFCYTKGLVMQLMCVLVYLAGTHIAVLEVAEISNACPCLPCVTANTSEE